MISFEIRLANFLDSVSFIADKDRQRAVWVEGSKGVSSVITLEELYAQFFDDNDIDNFIEDELDASPLTYEQRLAIRTFRGALNNFSKAPDKTNQKIPDRELVDDPEWNELNDLAMHTLTMFGGLVSC